MMKFDLFDAMSHMKKNFGSSGEILVMYDDIVGLKIRLSVFSGGEFHHNQFSITDKEIMSDNNVLFMNLKFKRAIEELKHFMQEQENA